MDFLLACMLLTSPIPEENVESLAKMFPVKDTPELRQAIQEFASKLEILDEYNFKYYLGDLGVGFYEDLFYLRERYIKTKDAPPISDCDRFPPKECTFEYLEFNRKYNQYLLDSKIMSYEQNLYLEIIKENQCLYNVWDNVRIAQSTGMGCYQRKTALMNLRDGIGQEAYDKADLPPHVPIWRFRDDRK